MDEQEQKVGRERVRRQLIEPLDRLLRLKRPRKVKTEMAHVAALAEICKRLWYLTDEDLVILRETVIKALTPDGEWPSAAVVIGWGQTLRRKPEGDSPRVRKLVRWAANKPDIDDAILPAFYRWLQDHNRLPGEYDMRQIAGQALESARWVERMQEVRDRRGLAPEDEATLQMIMGDRARVAAILAEAKEVA